MLQTYADKMPRMSDELESGMDSLEAVAEFSSLKTLALIDKLKCKPKAEFTNTIVAMTKPAATREINNNLEFNPETSFFCAVRRELHPEVIVRLYEYINNEAVQHYYSSMLKYDYNPVVAYVYGRLNADTIINCVVGTLKFKPKHPSDETCSVMKNGDSEITYGDYKEKMIKEIRTLLNAVCDMFDWYGPLVTRLERNMTNVVNIVDRKRFKNDGFIDTAFDKALKVKLFESRVE